MEKTLEKLVLTRSFAVAPEKVWQAWMDADAMRIWFGQAEAPAWQADWDVRAGGNYRLVLRDSRGTDYTVQGVYREVEPNRRLVFTWDGTLRPFSTAFLAKRPAATITLGLLVLVQLVIAAMTTSPCLRWNFLPSQSIGTPSNPGSGLRVAGVAGAAAFGSTLWPPSPSHLPSGEPLAAGRRLE